MHRRLFDNDHSIHEDTVGCQRIRGIPLAIPRTLLFATGTPSHLNHASHDGTNGRKDYAPLFPERLARYCWWYSSAL